MKNFDLSWFLTIQGMLVSAGVLLLLVAIIVLLYSSSRDKKEKKAALAAEQPQASDVVANSNASVQNPVNTNTTIPNNGGTIAQATAPNLTSGAISESAPMIDNNVAMPMPTSTVQNNNIPLNSQPNNLVSNVPVADVNSVNSSMYNVPQDNVVTAMPSTPIMQGVPMDSANTIVNSTVSNVNMEPVNYQNTAVPPVVEPAPVEPMAVEPVPVEPIPVEPVPIEPLVEPAPVEPVPVEPVIQAVPVEPVVQTVPGAYGETFAQTQVSPSMPVEVTPTIQPQASVQPVIYGGASPVVSNLNLGQNTSHEIYGGANPLENTQSMPIMGNQAMTPSVSNTVNAPGVSVSSAATMTVPVMEPINESIH